MTLTTDFVYPDEPCYGLFEGPLMRTVGKGQDYRWCQVVRVIRGDRKAEYLTDMGPAENFELVTPVMMPSFGENTVAQLQDRADRNRHDTYWQERAKQQQAESTLIADHIRQFEQIHEVIRNRSIFGPAVTVQRNGYSHITSERNLMARKRERTGKVQK